MDRGEIFAIAQIVAATAAIASVIYLALQVRQNTRAIRADSYRSLVATSVELLRVLAVEPEFASLFNRAASDPDGLSETERLRWDAFVLASLRHWDDMYYQYRRGMLEAEIWRSYDRTMSGWLRRAGWRTWLKAHMDLLTEEMQDLLAGKLAGLERSGPSSPPGRGTPRQSPEPDRP